jgi:hypothetical protein
LKGIARLGIMRRMVAVSDVILSASLVELIGGDEFADMLSGRMLRDVAAELSAALVAGLAISQIRRLDTVSYTVNGRSFSFGVDAAAKVVTLLKGYLGNSGGPVAMPVVFG